MPKDFEETIDFEDSAYDWREMIQLCDQNLIDMDIHTPLDEVVRKGWETNRDKLLLKVEKLKGASCEIESGQRAIKELLRSWDRRLVQKDWNKSDKEADKRKEVNLQKILDVKILLLRRTYKALHPQSPLKREYNDWQFVQMWEDFDPRILSQFVREPIEKGKTIAKLAKHLVILAQGTYRQFINDKGFRAVSLKVYEDYKGISDYEPQFRDTAVYPKDHPLYKESKHELTKNLPRAIWLPPEEDLPKELKDLFVKKTSQAVEAQTLRENKMKEKWEMFLAQDKWCQEKAPPYYKKQWNKEKAWCEKKLNGLQIKINEAAHIVWAQDTLLNNWLKNEIPIFPTQKIIKEYLQKVEPMVFDDAISSFKNFWKKAMMDARGWVYLPWGGRGANKD